MTVDLRALRDRMNGADPAEAAALLDALDSPAERAAAFATLGRDAAADVFEHLDHDAQTALVEALASEPMRLADLLERVDDRTAFFADLPGPAVQRLLTLLSPKERAVAVRLLGYPPDPVGRLMTTEYVAVRPDWTAGEALRQVRRYGRTRRRSTRSTSSSAAGASSRPSASATSCSPTPTRPCAR